MTYPVALEKTEEGILQLWLSYAPPPPAFEGFFVIQDIFHSLLSPTLPALFDAEMPIVQTLLLFQSENQKPILIRQANSFSGNFSLSLNLHVALGKAIALIENTFQKARFTPDSPPFSPEYKPINSFSVNVLLLWKKRLVNSFRAKQSPANWGLLYGNLPNFSPFTFEVSEMKRLTPPAGVLWADPFLSHHEGKTFVFFEEILEKQKKGHISVMQWLGNDTFTPVVCVLEKDYHLSFPFVFEWQNRKYMIPESQENATISLYEATDFPFQWAFKRHLIENIEAGDSVIHYNNEKWWLFTSVKNPTRPDFPKNHAVLDELSIFYTDNLLEGKWIPHPQNPVISDITASLNAGKIFVENGKLYRTAQIGTPHYGYGIQLCEITRLDEVAFNQVKIRTFFPSSLLKGVHTLNFGGNAVIMDGLYED